MTSRQTPSQTVGPFFGYGLTAEQYRYPGAQIAGSVLADDSVPGERIRITGRVLDGAGAPIPDALLEIWQADAAGHYVGEARGNTGFRGFGRQGTGTDPDFRFSFATVKPGAIGGNQAPHVTVILFMRGLLSHVYTRIYFSDEGAANERDPVLASVPAARRRTLIAERQSLGGETVYRFDIRMQGKDETVFFDA
jgi:protocatechuate 3,4-dioxygenase alpha subunit